MTNNDLNNAINAIREIISMVVSHDPMSDNDTIVRKDLIENLCEVETNLLRLEAEDVYYLHDLTYGQEEEIEDRDWPRIGDGFNAEPWSDPVDCKDDDDIPF